MKPKKGTIVKVDLSKIRPDKTHIWKGRFILGKVLCEAQGSKGSCMVQLQTKDILMIHKDEMHQTKNAEFKFVKNKGPQL